MAFAWLSPEAFKARSSVAVTSSALIVEHNNQSIQVANDRAGQKTLVRWIGKQNGSLVVFEATGAYHRHLEAALAVNGTVCQGQSASGAQVCRSDWTIGQD